jgi:hypothetical protein
MIKMNKSVALMNLPLPRDVSNYICSFVYYTHAESYERIRNNFHQVLCDLFYTIRLQETHLKYNVIMIYNIQSHFDITFYICKCGNYRRKCKCIT